MILWPYCFGFPEKTDTICKVHNDNIVWVICYELFHNPIYQPIPDSNSSFKTDFCNEDWRPDYESDNSPVFGFTNSNSFKRVSDILSREAVRKCVQFDIPWNISTSYFQFLREIRTYLQTEPVNCSQMNFQSFAKVVLPPSPGSKSVGYSFQIIVGHFLYHINICKNCLINVFPFLKSCQSIVSFEAILFEKQSLENRFCQKWWRQRAIFFYQSIWSPAISFFWMKKLLMKCHGET